MPRFWSRTPRPHAPRWSLPSPLLAIGAALAGQVALGQGLWLAGGLLLAAGAALVASAALAGARECGSAATSDLPGDAEHATRPSDKTLVGGWQGAAMLLGLCAVAAAFRVPLQGSLPPGLAADEARVGLSAAAVLADGLTADSWNGWPVFHLLTVWSVKLLGQTALAVRSPAILGGIASVAAVFLLGRQLGGTVLGLLAGLLAAVLFWHADATRAAWGYVAWGVAAEALGVALLLRAARQRDGLSAGCAGVLLGLGVQVSWSAIAALLAAVALAWGAFRTEPARESFARSVVAPFLVYFVIAIGPVIIGITVPDRHLTPTSSLDAVGNLTENVGGIGQRIGGLALMFNVAGDPRTVHNLGGRPHLDTVTAALFALGIALAAVSWRTPTGGPVLIWLLTALGFAAFAARTPTPDSLAAFSAVTPAVLLAAAGLYFVSKPPFPMHAFAAHWRLDLMVLAVLLVVAANAHTLYVQRPQDAATWAAFASAESMAAQEISEVASSRAIYLADVWLHHPTIRFLAPDMGEPQRFDTAGSLPLRQDQGFAYFAPGHQEVVAEDLERIYESGEIDRYRSPLDDEVIVLRSFRASASDVAEARGVTLRATATERSRTNRYTLTTFDVGWPIPGEPARAALDLFTALSVDTAGEYRFRLDGPPGATIEINGAPAGRVGEDVRAFLAAGSQRIRVLASFDSPGNLSLRWQPPDAAEPVPIPASRLYREQRVANGLLAVYRTDDDESASPDLVRVERWVQREASDPPVSRPYTLDLVGILDLPKSGTYRFRLAGSGPAAMWLDDRPVPLGSLPSGEAASMVLPEGDHRIRLRLRDETGPTRLNLTWAPPNEDWGAIPTSRFLPPTGPVENAVAAGNLPDFDVRALGAPRVTWLASLDGEPRAVAVGADGSVYVTNVTSRETQHIADPSRPALSIDNLSASIPADVEVAPDGAVWVLDALDGQLRRADQASGQVQIVGASSLGLYRPRGFGHAPDGSVVVADTGGSRLIQLAPDGTLIDSIGPDVGGPVRVRQPTDVAVARNGDLYVVNGEGGSVLHLTSSGEYIRHWSVLPADTERGSHVAIGPDGSVWISEPDGRRISRFTPTGVPAGVVDQTREGRLLRAPVGIAVGSDGTLYVADVSLRAIVAITFRP